MSILTKGFFDYYENKVEENKAFEIRTKMKDDGSIRALIVNGNYSNIGRGIIIQKKFDDEIAWTLEGGGCCSTACTVTKDFDEYGNFNTAEKVAEEVRTLCRRKFKKENIILCVVDSFYSLEEGIIFLEDKICTINQKKLEYMITYEEMEDVDFDETSVMIKVIGGEIISLYCGDEEEYSKGIYNLLMDIKDRLDEQ